MVENSTKIFGLCRFSTIETETKTERDRNFQNFFLQKAVEHNFKTLTGTHGLTIYLKMSKFFLPRVACSIVGCG